MARHLSGCVAFLAVALAAGSGRASSPAVSQPPAPGAAAPAPASNPPAERPAPPPAIREFDLVTLARLGRELYLQDQLAWHATDALVAAIGMDTLAAGSPRGWVVDVSGPRPLVRFLRATATGVEAAYDVRFPATGKPVVETASDRRLTPGQMRRQQAVGAARQALVDGQYPMWRGSGTYNTVVLDDPAGRGFLVYFLRPKPSTAEIPVGGHYRITVSADGRTVRQVDRLFVSFLTVPKSAPTGSDMAAAVVTSLVSDKPLETHVFLSLQDKVPFYVGTRDGTFWKISEGEISVLKERGPGADSPGHAR